MNQSIYCPFCGSVYEDAPNNYLIDYAIVNGGLPGRPTFAQLLGVNSNGERFFLPVPGYQTVGRFIAPCPFIWKTQSFRQ